MGAKCTKCLLFSPQVYFSTCLPTSTRENSSALRPIAPKDSIFKPKSSDISSVLSWHQLPHRELLTHYSSLISPHWPSPFRRKFEEIVDPQIPQSTTLVFSIAPILSLEEARSYVCGSPYKFQIRASWRHRSSY